MTINEDEMRQWIRSRLRHPKRKGEYVTTINAPGGSCSSDSLCPRHGVPMVHTITDGPPLCAVCVEADKLALLHLLKRCVTYVRDAGVVVYHYRPVDAPVIKMTRGETEDAAILRTARAEWHDDPKGGDK